VQATRIYNTRIRFALIAVIVLSPFAVATANDGGLAVNGAHSLPIKPQKIRLTMNVVAEGKDPKDAIKRLAEQKDKVRKELVSMKADESSIEFKSAQIQMTTPGMPEQMKQYGGARAMRARIQQGGFPGNNKKKKAADDDEDEIPQIAIAQSAVKVEWQLPSTDLDALAILPKTLKDQVTQRDLEGKKNKLELDDDVKDKIEEMTAMFQEQMGYYSESGNSEDAIQITFVAKVSPKDEAAGAKAAFDDAVAKAKQISEATGTKLGRLRGISTDGNSASEDFRSYPSYSPYGMPNVTARMRFTQSNDEVLSAQPDDLVRIIRVNLVFDFEQ
jgi:uncharacterized protein YggE